MFKRLKTYPKIKIDRKVYRKVLREKKKQGHPDPMAQAVSLAHRRYMKK